MNNNHSRGILGKVIAFQSPRSHNCPNCQCHNQIRSPNHIITHRPASPVFNQNIKQIPVSNIPVQYPGHFGNKPIIVSSNVVRQRVIRKNPINQNLYFKKTDRCDSQNSLGSNRSISSRASNEGKIIQLVSSPKKAQQINIRYVSPPKQNNNQVSIYHTSNRQQRQINAFHNGNAIRQIQKSLYHMKTNQNFTSIQKSSYISESDMQPKVPSILKKRSSQNRKQRPQSPEFSQPSEFKPTNYQQNYHSKSKQQQKQTELGTVSAIFSKNVIQKRAPSQSFIVKGQWQPSAYDVLIQQQQQKVIAQQISRDLKLNYDYLQTRDISDLSQNK